MWKRFRLWLEYSRTVSALSRLDDRTLKDIGVGRSGIRGLAMDLTYR